MLEQFFIIDLPALIIVILASILCSLLGSFLILKKQAIMVDAISHSVLPGIVVGVLLSGTFAMIYVMGGALISSLIAVWLVYIIQYWGGVERGAAIGTVFTAMFAIGVVLLETKIGPKIHLDTQHVLYGALELTYWPAPHSWQTMPTQIKTLSVMLALTLAFIWLFFKELRLTTFDSGYANILGYKSRVFHMILMTLTALCAVSCFEATGSILVVALFICPAAAARLLCDDLKAQLILSAGIAAICSILGYTLSALVPVYLEVGYSLNGAAAIALCSGMALLGSVIFSPRYGVFSGKTTHIS